MKEAVKTFTIIILLILLCISINLLFVQKERIQELEQMDNRRQKEVIIKDLERVEFLLEEIIENQELEVLKNVQA